jgi:hypothetical protein
MAAGEAVDRIGRGEAVTSPVSGSRSQQNNALRNVLIKFVVVGLCRTPAGMESQSAQQHQNKKDDQD